MDDGRTGRAGTILDDAHILDALANHLEGVEHPRQHDDGGAVLVVVEHRDVQFPLQFRLDLETLGAADVFQIDAAEGRRDGLDGGDHFLLAAGVQADGECVHTAELFEQDALALHDRQARLGADVAQAQHRRAVGDDRHRAALEGVGIHFVRVGLDPAAGFRHAGGVGGGERVFVLAGHQALHRQFAGAFGMQFQGGFVVVHSIPLLFLPVIPACARRARNRVPV